MKDKVSNFIFLVVGIVIGLSLAIQAFDIHVDILGIPYRNQPVILTEDITIYHRSSQITLPKDITLIRRYITEYGDTYVLYFDDSGVSVEETDEWEVF